MRVSAVIGSSYGDEGKGLVTDYLSSSSKALVVRFNGGAQAGHTVVEPGGRRHVFHHFGSGTLLGADSYLSEHFLVNPLSFVEEKRQLLKMGITPVVFVDPRARVSTPWDMILNQCAEASRKGNRHGSCGLGIHETVVRCRTGFGTAYWQMLDKDGFEAKVRNVMQLYFPRRLKELKIPESAVTTFDFEGIFAHFMQDVEICRQSTIERHWGAMELGPYEHLIFEGAQGLRLDEDAPGFPHVTCSKTGLTNVVKLLNERRMRDMVEVHYVTRPYITRHGAGPLAHEDLGGTIWLRERDKTNVHNQWQKSIRFGFLDLEAFKEAVASDFYDSKIDGDPRIFLTCADHIEGGARWVDGGTMTGGSLREFVESLKLETQFKQVTISTGPTRNDVHSYP